MKRFERLTIYCDCETPEHQFNFIKDPEDDEIWLEIHLNNYDRFLKRLWTGLKYAFGYRSKYGHWDTTIITPEDRLKIIEFLKS